MKLKHFKTFTDLVQHIQSLDHVSVTTIPVYDGLKLTYAELTPYMKYTNFVSDNDLPYQEGHLVLKNKIFSVLVKQRNFQICKTVQQCMRLILELIKTKEKVILDNILAQNGQMFDWIPYGEHTVTCHGSELLDKLRPLTELPWLVNSYHCIVTPSGEKVLDIPHMLGKLKHQTYQSRITNITWVHTKGILIPVANIRPITHNNKNINTIPLHNYKFVKDYCLQNGDYVTVVIDEFNYVQLTNIKRSQTSQTGIPIQCPSCGGDLETFQNELKCVEYSCVETILSKITMWCNILKLDTYISMDQIRPLVMNIDPDSISSIVGLLNVTPETLDKNSHMSKKEVKDFIKAITKLKKGGMLSKGRMLHGFIPVGLSLQICEELNCVNYREVKNNLVFNKLSATQQNDIFSMLRVESGHIRELCDILKVVM